MTILLLILLFVIALVIVREPWAARWLADAMERSGEYMVRLLRAQARGRELARQAYTEGFREVMGPKYKNLAAVIEGRRAPEGPV